MKSVEIPVYSFVEHQRTKETQYLYGASVVILEGLFILSDPALRDLIDMKVFGMFPEFLAIAHIQPSLLAPRSSYESFYSTSGLGSHARETDTKRYHRKRQRCARYHHAVSEV
jgi:hypothetical protein